MEILKIEIWHKKMSKKWQKKKKEVADHKNDQTDFIKE